MKKDCLRLLLILGCLLSSYGYADFKVEGAQESDSSIYGHAQAEEFRRAMQGGVLTTDEQNEINDLIPEKPEHRWYFRLRGSRSTVALKNIRNKAESPFDVLIVAKKEIGVDQTGLEIAIGYVLQNWRWDIEYLVNKNLNFVDDAVFGSSSAIISGVTIGNIDFSGKIRNQILIANFYYDFKDFVLMTPYVTAGIGLSTHKSQANVTGFPGITQGRSKRTNGLAWTIGLGARYRLFSRMDLDIGYRTIFLGYPKFKNSNAIQIQGKHVVSGLFLGINWLL